MIKIIINGIEADVANIDSFGFRASFRDSEIQTQELNIDTLVLQLASKVQIENWINTNGAFIGIPVMITYGTLIFDYYIDLTENPIFRDDEVEVKIKKSKGKDNFFDLADALTFELLKQRGVVFHTFSVPYVIIKENQTEIGVMLALAIFSMTQATIQAVKDLANIGAEFTAALALSPAHAISAGIKLIAQIIYTTALVVALIQLLNDFKELLFPNIRYYLACKVKDLIQVGCQNLGFTLSSTLLDSLSGLTVLPVPLQKTNKSIFKFKQNDLNQSFTKGYPTAQDTTPTLGSLIRAVELTLNCKTKVNNGLVQIESKQFFSQNSQLNLNPALNLQDSRRNEYTLNTTDAWIRYYVHYLTDFTDLNTLDNFEPNDAEYGAKNVIQTTPELNLLKGLRDIQIPFALGTNKTEYNFIEKLALKLFETIDSITSGNLSSLITERLNVLQISQQYFGTSKLLYTSTNGKQPSNYLDIIKANSLFQNYHAYEKIELRGFKDFANAPIEMNFEEFNQILNSNYANIDGDACEILSIEHIPRQSISNIDYRLPFNYANGKITTFAVNV